MSHQLDYNALNEVVEVLIEKGFEGFADALTILLNESMRIERSQVLQAGPYERSSERKGYANGYKPKRVKSRVGELELAVPQVRGDVDFYPSCLEKGCRSEKALYISMAEMYFNGVATRKVKKILESLCGLNVTSQQVSRATEKLDVELTSWRNRSLGSISYVILDAKYEKVRIEGVVRDAAILSAIGVKEDDGKRMVLGVHVSLSEAEVYWREFLESLNLRGIRGIKMVTSDDHAGLRAALKSVWTNVPWQRCQFHLQQNAGHYVTRKEDQKEVASDIRDIFNSQSMEKAQQCLKETVEKYQESNPKLSQWMELNLPEGFTVFSQPRNSWKRLRTSNASERLNQEIGRRTKTICVFPNESSLLRLATAILAEKSDEWEAGKAYLKIQQ